MNNGFSSIQCTSECTVKDHYVSHQSHAKRISRIKHFIAQQRRTRLSDPVFLMLIRKHYWLIGANICPFCYKSVSSFHGMLIHFSNHTDDIIYEYNKLSAEFRQQLRQSFSVRAKA